MSSCLKGPLFVESLTRRAGWESQQDQAARAEKKKIFDALALASILHNSALESASKVVFSPFWFIPDLKPFPVPIKKLNL